MFGVYDFFQHSGSFVSFIHVLVCDKSWFYIVLLYEYNTIRSIDGSMGYFQFWLIQVSAVTLACLLVYIYIYMFLWVCNMEWYYWVMDSVYG